MVALDKTTQNQQKGELTSSSHVSSENYPLSQPLAAILRAVVKKANVDNDIGSDKFEIVKESIEDALHSLIRNCFVAIDSMYFYTQPTQRNRPTFQHRLCIRISTCNKTNTLTITDLGSGMTRSDIINFFVGTKLSHDAMVAARHLQKAAKGTHASTSNVSAKNNKGNNMNDESSWSGSDDYNYDDDSDSDDSSTSENGLDSSNKQQKIKIPCTAESIGGFYSAFCSLGTSIEIGSKSKFDDYYIFKLSRDNDFSWFEISRPMKEGSVPLSSNGYNNFTDVRGESGTRITITLNEQAISAGMLNQPETLKPMLTKFLEESPYTVVLEECCADEAERLEIINASQIELEDIERTAMEEQNNEEANAITDAFVFTNGTDTNDSYHSVKERSKYIPLRLSMSERKMLRLVESSMSCCDYTTVVDKKFKSTTRRTHCQLKNIFSVLRGMVSSCNYNAGQKLLSDDNDPSSSFSYYEKFFQEMFEIARRHKIMNPEKMRSEYGKLIYLLQDAASPSISQQLIFSCKGPIKTVYNFLEERDGLGLLDDKLIDIATREVLSGKKTRAEISVEIKRKEKAVSILKQKYCNSSLSSEDIHLCLYSICDNDSFLNSNRVPIDKVIGYLRHFFSPGKIEDGYSLSIVSGEDGSRLSHSHDRQYYFALQSLTLWRDIIDDMFRLWAMAEEDLLSESITYCLKDTGQGMQRVQQSPQTYKAMQKILNRVQVKVNQWIGSNVIHLGDHNVPNALTFIDKYVQVPRILSPIVTCLENLERICDEDDGIKSFIENGFGGVEQLKKDILYDFFRSAFDGSGADNFYDAGSCIDGRLTSAWNWCSQLPDKPFYCVFKLTGFTSFDGSEFK